MLELKNVTKTFNLTGNKEDLRVALDHVNLQIESGEFVTIIGSNGSGKTTVNRREDVHIVSVRQQMILF